MEALGQIIEILFGGVTSTAEGLASGLNALVENLFWVPAVGTSGSEGYVAAHLTTFATVVIVFAAISLSIGLSRYVVNMIRRFGK